MRNARVNNARADVRSYTIGARNNEPRRIIWPPRRKKRAIYGPSEYSCFIYMLALLPQLLQRLLVAFLDQEPKQRTGKRRNGRVRDGWARPNHLFACLAVR